MEQRQTISQIAECVISEMERMQYSPATISTFRVKAKQLSRYVQEKTGRVYLTDGNWVMKKSLRRMLNQYRLRTTAMLQKSFVSTTSGSSMSFWHHGKYLESMTYPHKLFLTTPRHSKGNPPSIRSTD